jgi:hypothetical protein
VRVVGSDVIATVIILLALPLALIGVCVAIMVLVFRTPRSDPKRRVLARRAFYGLLLVVAVLGLVAQLLTSRLLVGVPLVLIAVSLAFGFWSRRGGLNDWAQRRRPDGYRKSFWPTSRLGWALVVLLGALWVGTLGVLVHARAWSSVSGLLVVSLGSYLGTRWAKGGRANSSPRARPRG